jgi:FG-GAP-like repeat
MTSLRRVVRAIPLLLLTLPLFAELPDLQPGPLVCEDNCHPLIADFTGDGLDDYIDKAMLHVNVGGAFAAPIPVTGFSTSEMAPLAADFTADGLADLFVFAPGMPLPPGVGNGATPDGPYKLMINQGNGVFRHKEGLGFRHVEGVLDYDVDGKLDVISGEPKGPNASQLVLFRGGGDGTFTRVQTLQYVHPETHGGTRDFVTGDFNNDGRPDIVVSAWEYISFFFSRPDGLYGEPVGRYVGKDRGLPMVSGDVNGDGNRDLVIANATIEVLYGDGTGRFPDVARHSVFVGPEPPLPPPFVSQTTPSLNTMLAVPIFGEAHQLVLAYHDGTIVTVVASPVGQLRELDRTQIEWKNTRIDAGHFREPGKLDLLARGAPRVVNTKYRAQFVYAQGRLPITLTTTGSRGRGRAVNRVVNRGRGGAYEVRWSGACAPAPTVIEFQQEGIFVNVLNRGNAQVLEMAMMGDEMVSVRFVGEAGGTREIEGYLIESGNGFAGRIADQHRPYAYACDGSPAIYSIEITPKRF